MFSHFVIALNSVFMSSSCVRKFTPKVIFRFALVSVCLASLNACTSVNQKVGAAFSLDTDLRINFVVAGDINPDEAEQSSPVFVRMYELNSTQAFEQSDFIDIYEKDEEILGDSLVAKQELERLIPGVNRQNDFVLNKDTRYVALFAEFFRYKDAKTKVIFPITTTNVVRNTIEISLNENNIQLNKK